MNVEQSLKALTNYPVPHDVIELACITGLISSTDELTNENLRSIGYMKAERHVIKFLLIAPNSISELGVSFSVGEDEKTELRERLSELDREINNAEIAAGGTPKSKPYKVSYWES